MFAGGLARRTAQRRRLHPQTLQGNRLAAIRAVAVDPAIRTLQGGVNFGAQFPQTVVQRIAQLRQMSLGGEFHGLSFRWAIDR